MAELLSDTQISDALTGLAEWQRDGSAIRRTVKMPSFPAAIETVRAVGDLAESHQHHPDIDIRYWNLTFRLSTHSEGGITAKDTQLGGEIDRIIDEVSARAS